jgi:hypothetical protein
MSIVIAEADATVDAPAGLVLQIIRDFAGHHRRILPAAFSDFRVLAGGVGAGTVTSFTTTLGGRKVHGQTVVTEPAAGVVREDVVGRDMVTTFRVQELGNHAFVTIRTTWTPAGGINGFFERKLAPRMLRDVYRQELELLQAYARELDGYGAYAAAGAPVVAAG